jgi:tetratricopeptide (TPR) repeat protein
MISDRTYTILKWVAVAGAVVWLSLEVYRHFGSREPGDMAYLTGNNFFKDHYYKRAEESYRDALKENPRHLPAIRGLANALVQLKRREEALVVINHAIKLDPEFAGHYATRGIIYDHLGRHGEAIADYELSLKMDNKVAKGMHWLDRLLYNVQETPPTVADRLAYLKKQMSLPKSERRLHIRELDEQQRPYEQ